MDVNRSAVSRRKHGWAPQPMTCTQRRRTCGTSRRLRLRICTTSQRMAGSYSRSEGVTQAQAQARYHLARRNLKTIRLAT